MTPNPRRLPPEVGRILGALGAAAGGAAAILLALGAPTLVALAGPLVIVGAAGGLFLGVAWVLLRDDWPRD